MPRTPPPFFTSPPTLPTGKSPAKAQVPRRRPCLKAPAGRAERRGGATSAERVAHAAAARAAARQRRRGLRRWSRRRLRRRGRAAAPRRRGRGGSSGVGKGLRAHWLGCILPGAGAAQQRRALCRPRRNWTMDLELFA
eukprot:gene8575-biopygen13681